jgi:hypothetical protein
MLLSFLLLLSASIAGAQSTAPAPDANEPSQALETQKKETESPARLVIYFDLISHSRSLAAKPGERVKFSVVAESSAGGIKAWEARVVLGEGITVIDRQADGLNLGASLDEWRVGLGKQCKQEQEIVLATYTVTVAPNAGHDLVLGLAPVPNGSFDPPAPGYLACEGLHDLRAFACADTAAVINPERVRLEDSPRAGKTHFKMGKAGN